MPTDNFDLDNLTPHPLNEPLVSNLENLDTVITTINFDDLAPGTVVDHQYEPEGIEFRASSFFDGGLPFIAQPDEGQSHSGKQVLVIKNCSGEFCPSAVVGKFKYTCKSVQIFVGNLEKSSSAIHVTLFAYDAGGKVLTSSSVMLPTEAGINTMLRINRETADIDSFEVRADGFTGRLAIDDLSFNMPAVGAIPNFGITREGPIGDGVRQGFSATATIKVNRVNGSTGPIEFTTNDLPFGVTAIFEPNSTDADLITMTLHAAPDAAVVNAALITVNAIPKASSAGAESHTLTFPLTVAANFAIEPLTIDIPCCSSATSLLTLCIPNTLESKVEPGLIPRSDFNRPISLSVLFEGETVLPAGVTLSFDPSVVSFTDDLEITTPVKVTIDASIHNDIKLSVIGISEPYVSSSAQLTLHPIVRVDSFSPTVGETPHALLPGTDILITGAGFCSEPDFPIEVQFGNKYARTKARLVSSDSTQIHANVPRLATDGPITIITPIGSFSSKESFTVRSFRNTNGFSFHNFSLNDISYDDLTEAFGENQTYLTITIDPCSDIPDPPWPLPRLYPEHCPVLSVGVVPNPLGLVFWKILTAAGTLNAHCFGMSLTSERLLKGETPLSNFSFPGATCAWQLAAPEAPWEVLSHHLRIQSLSQTSSEVWHYWLSEVAEGMLSAPFAEFQVTPLKNKIQEDLSSGNYPLIMMRNGSSGHVVLAYDLEDSSDSYVAFYIYIYDPNTEFAKGKKIVDKVVNENDNAEDHKDREEMLSRISIRKDGTWSYRGFDNGEPFPFHDFTHNLVVAPYNVIPRNPTFPTSIDGMATLFFGSVQVAQISDANGYMLKNMAGTLNMDPTTCLRKAVPLPFFNQNQGTLSEGYILGNPGLFKLSLSGTNSGEYSNISFGQNFCVYVDSVLVNETSMDEISIHPGETRFNFRTNDSSKPLAITLFTGGTNGTAVRTVRLRTTSYSGGQDSIEFDALHETISYQHSGNPTSFSIELGQAGDSGLPKIFTSPSLNIGSGDIAVFNPTNWISLSGSPVALTITRSDGTQEIQTLNSIADQSIGFDIARLQIEETNDKQKIFQILTTFQETDDSQIASALVTWLITKEGQIVSQSHITLKGIDLKTQSRSDSWIFNPQETGTYEFTGIVTVVTGDVLQSSQIRQKSLSFTIG